MRQLKDIRFNEFVGGQIEIYDTFWSGGVSYPGDILLGEISEIEVKDEKLRIEFAWLAKNVKGKWVKLERFCGLYLYLKLSSSWFMENPLFVLARPGERALVFYPKERIKLDPSQILEALPIAS